MLCKSRCGPLIKSRTISSTKELAKVLVSCTSTPSLHSYCHSASSLVSYRCRCFRNSRTPPLLLYLLVILCCGDFKLFRPCRRCKFLGCTKSARGRTDFCVRHGGGKRCVAPGCDKSAQGKTDLCKAHGGGKKCQYKADDFLSPCERFARGKTGLCAAHMALMKKKEKEQAEELGVAETGLQLGAPGGPQGLWMRAGGEGPEANQLFYHVFSPNDQFGAARAQPVDDGMEDQKMPYFAMPLPGPDVDSNKFGEGRVRGGGGAAQLLNAPPVPAGPADMDVQKLDEVNAFRQAEASRIVSLYNQNASPDVRHVVGAAHETLSAGGGVFGWASHPRGGEGVAESGPESVGGSSSGRLTDALFSEAYPGSGDERVRGESSVLTWLQSGLPLEKLSSGFGFSDSGSSHGGGWGSTHAGSLFTSHLGGGGQKEEGSKHGGDEMGGSRGFAGHDSMDLSNSGRGMSKGTNSSAVLDPSQGGMSSQGSTHMGAPLPTVEAFLAGFEAGRKRGGAGSSLSTGAVRAPARGGAFQSFSDGGLLSRRPFKPDLRGWEFGVNNNQPGLSHGQGPSAQNSHGLGPNPSPGARGALGSLRRLQERQWQEVQRGRASGDVSMMDHVASLSSPVWLADDAVEMPPPRSSGGVRAQEYRGPFMTRRSQDDLHQAPRTSGAAPFSDAPRRFHFDADSDQETSTFAGSILTQGGLGEDESVRGGNAFYSDEPLASETLNHLMLRDEPECVPSPATAAFVATSMMDSPAVAPLPKSLEGLGPDDLGPDLEHGTFSGMMASIINNSPQLNVQFPSATMGMQKLDLPEPAADSVLSNVSGVFEHV